LTYLVKVKKIPLDRIILYGYCLGGSYATLSAFYWKGIAGIVLDRPVPSYSKVGNRLLFLIPSFLGRWLNKVTINLGVNLLVGLAGDKGFASGWRLFPRSRYAIQRFVLLLNLQGNGMENIDLFNKYTSIRHPTLYFYGTKDVLIPPHRQFTLASAIFEPNSDLKLSSLDQLTARHPKDLYGLTIGHMDFSGKDPNFVIYLSHWFRTMGAGKIKDKKE
jgi:pimeloyl-ACP methyl ester carboxylesterase